MKLSIKVVFVAALAVTAIGILSAKVVHRLRDAATPVVFSVSPSAPGPNADVLATIQLSSPSVGGDVIAIGSTDPLAFTSLPSEVYVPAGQTSVSFSCHTSAYYSGWTVIAATMNGGTALAITQ